MKHFTYITATYVCKNKLEKAILQELESQNRKFLAEAELNSMKVYIIMKIKELNELHPKCKPIAAHWDSDEIKGFRAKDWMLRLGNGLNSPVCHYVIYSTKI